MLDIIIPVYNNQKGLERTIFSIPHWFRHNNVTIINDCSTTQLQLDFSYDKYLCTAQNSGPGIARQLGINNTHGQYIMFIDAGDYFLNDSEEIFDEILHMLDKNPDVDIFTWQYLQNSVPADTNNNTLHGKIYKRSFLEKYNIHFSAKGSYGNEDIGFNHLCNLIGKQYGCKRLEINKPVMVYDTEDTNSITRANGHKFLLSGQNLALAYNAIDAYFNAAAAGCSQDLLMDYANYIMATESFYFIRTSETNVEYAQDMWSGMRYYFLNLYSQLESYSSSLNTIRVIKRFQKLNNGWRTKLPINLQRLYKQLQNDEKVPSYYLTQTEIYDII